MSNEADTCRRFVVPRLQAAGWDTEPHRLNEQVTFTDGRIVVTGQKSRRRPGKRADGILRYRPDMPIAVVEAKPTYASNRCQRAAEGSLTADRLHETVTNWNGVRFGRQNMASLSPARAYQERHSG